MKFLSQLPRHATSGLVAGGIAAVLAPLMPQQAFYVSVLFAVIWLLVTLLQLHFVWLAMGALITAALLVVVPQPGWALVWLPLALSLAVMTWRNTVALATHHTIEPQWGYRIAALLMLAGVVNFGLISLRLPDWQVGGIFAIAMLVAATVAYISRFAYRRSPVAVLVSLSVLTTMVGVLALSQPQLLVLVSALLWGVLMGLHRGVLGNLISSGLPIAQPPVALIAGIVVVLQAAVTGLLFYDAPLGLGVFVSVTQAIAAIIVLERSNLV